MSKNKVKFQPVTLVLNKKELKLLQFLVGNTAWSDCETLVKSGGISYDLYNKLNNEMLTQGIKPINKYIDFTITE